MTQESLMMNLNNFLSSLSYPEPDVYKTHSIDLFKVRSYNDRTLVQIRQRSRNDMTE